MQKKMQESECIQRFGDVLDQESHIIQNKPAWFVCKMKILSGTPAEVGRLRTASAVSLRPYVVTVMG